MAFAEKVVCAEPLVYSNLCSGTFVSLAKPLNILACSFDFQFLSLEYFRELAIFSRLEGLVMVVCG